MSVQILHGLKLAAEPPKRITSRKTAWTVSFRASDAIIDELDKICRGLNASRGDVLRTAAVEFIEKCTAMGVIDKPHSLAPASAPPSPVQPQMHDAYRGNGRSDFTATQAVNERQASRKHAGKQGERLVDKTPSR